MRKSGKSTGCISLFIFIALVVILFDMFETLTYYISIIVGIIVAVVFIYKCVISIISNLRENSFLGNSDAQINEYEENLIQSNIEEEMHEEDFFEKADQFDVQKPSTKITAEAFETFMRSCNKYVELQERNDFEQTERYSNASISQNASDSVLSHYKNIDNKIPSYDVMEEHYFENYCTDLPSENDSQSVISDKASSNDINCNNKQQLEEKNRNTINKKHNSKKTTRSNEDFNTFLWQCNSISELRDSKDIGYEYTELDNPNETLENGYRDALLDISDYTKLPLIDTSQDKYALHGYVERKMLSWEHDFEKCRNIFKDSTLPIIKDLSEITRNINTSILQNPDGTIGRTVNEIFFYKIPQEYQHTFCQLVNMLNESLAAHDLLEYQVNCADIKFSRTDNVYCKYSLPLSLIIYNGDKHTFHYKFSNEVSIINEYSTNYDNTEYGEIIYTEDGNLKNANFNKIINGSLAKCRFKNYKSGFDLYDIRYNKSIIYKRNQNK